MQSLDIISVNIWQILISLANLTILFLVIKKFLFKPVKNILAKRQAEIDDRYASAEEANKAAAESEKKWNEKLSNASAEADKIINDASESAKYHEQKILESAKEQAETIVSSAKQEAELELKKADAGIKQKIVEVSSDLAEKLLEREINTDDHRKIIDTFISDIDSGDGDE